MTPQTWGMQFFTSFGCGYKMVKKVKSEGTLFSQTFRVEVNNIQMITNIIQYQYGSNPV